jgi:hypothetical protein
MVRRLVLLAVLGAVLMAVLATSSAAAPNSSQLSIETNAQWQPGSVSLQLHVRCDGGFGGVNVQVSQSPPENQFPQQGFGMTGVLCDGQQHQAAIHVCCGNFDVGKAFALATLCSPFGCPGVTTSKTINITF